MKNGVDIIPRKRLKEKRSNITYVQWVCYHFSSLANVCTLEMSLKAENIFFCCLYTESIVQ